MKFVNSIVKLSLIVISPLLFGLVSESSAQDIINNDSDTAFESEVRFKGLFFNPSKSFYDNSFGGEIEGVIWLSEIFGLGLSLGYTNWDGDAFSAYRVRGGAVGVGIDGSVSQVPVVLSGEFRLPVNEKLSFNFSGGVGYSFVSSDLDYTALLVNNFGTIVAGGRGSVDMDDAVIGRVAASAHYSIRDNINLIAGIGYQQSVSGGDLKIDGTKINEKADLSAVYGFLGLGLKF